jgi:hypothetical protein
MVQRIGDDRVYVSGSGGEYRRRVQQQNMVCTGQGGGVVYRSEEINGINKNGDHRAEYAINKIIKVPRPPADE